VTSVEPSAVRQDPAQGPWAAAQAARIRGTRTVRSAVPVSIPLKASEAPVHPKRRKMRMQSLIDDPTRASRYLADQLSDAECAEYEARFTEDPDAVAELEATARLKIGLERLRRNGELSEFDRGDGRISPKPDMGARDGGEPGSRCDRNRSVVSAPGNVALTPILASTATAFRDHNGHSCQFLVTAPSIGRGPRGMTQSSSYRARAAPSNCGSCPRPRPSRPVTRLPWRVSQMTTPRSGSSPSATCARARKMASSICMRTARSWRQGDIGSFSRARQRGQPAARAIPS